MSDAPVTALTEPGLTQLLTLFAGPLAEVRFPDVDREALEREAAAVRAAAQAVAAARGQLEAAQAALIAAESELVARDRAILGLGHRGLAYARVFAEARPELRASLEAIALPAIHTGLEPRAAGPEGLTPRRRGRPRKVRPESPLFSAPSNDASAEEPGDEPAELPTEAAV